MTKPRGPSGTSTSLSRGKLVKKHIKIIKACDPGLPTCLVIQAWYGGSEAARNSVLEILEYLYGLGSKPSKQAVKTEEFIVEMMYASVPPTILE